MGCSSICQAKPDKIFEMNQDQGEETQANLVVKSSKKKKPIQEKPDEETKPQTIEYDKSNYSQALFNYINAARTQPALFADCFDKYAHYIIKNEDNTFSINVPGQTNGSIKLSFDDEAFERTIFFLKNMVPIEPFNYDTELELGSVYDERTATSIKSISEQLNRKIQELNGKYTKYSLNVDQDILDPELCAILQVVENIKMCSDKKRNVFSNIYTNLGVTTLSNGNDKVITYIIFAK